METDRLKNFGYKTKKPVFLLELVLKYMITKFGIGTSNYIEKITTNNSASTRQKKQAGNYLDSF